MNKTNYILPPPSLRNVVHSFWQTERAPSCQRERIIPKGVVEIIFNFSGGPPRSAQIGSRQCEVSKCFINGLNSTPISLQLPEQQVFFGIGIHLLAVKKIFGVPAAEFTNVLVDITLLDQAARFLWDELAGQDSFEKRVAVFCSWIGKKSVNWEPREESMNNFLHGPCQHDQSVKELSASLCYSSRQLSRKIFEATGRNTEELLHYKKYLHAVHLIHRTDLSLTEIAYHSHFSDQSHFIRSFRSYAAMTPSEYKRQKGFIEGHIFEDVR